MHPPIDRETAKRRILEIEILIQEIDKIGIFDDGFNAGRRERDRLDREALTLAREARLGMFEGLAATKPKRRVGNKTMTSTQVDAAIAAEEAS